MEHLPAGSGEQRSGLAEPVAAEALGRPAAGFQAKAAPAALRTVHPGYSDSAALSAAEIAGLPPVPIAERLPTHKPPARVSLGKSLNELARLVRKDLANENSLTALFV